MNIPSPEQIWNVTETRGGKGHGGPQAEKNAFLLSAGVSSAEL